MSTVNLSPTLEKRVAQLAEWLAQSPEALVTEAVEEHLEQLYQRKLEAEIVSFEAAFDTLRGRYGGQFVAIHEGEVIDHDSVFEPLFLRIQSRFGDFGILIRHVGTEPEPVWRYGSPRRGVEVGPP